MINTALFKEYKINMEKMLVVYLLCIKFEK